MSFSLYKEILFLSLLMVNSCTCDPVFRSRNHIKRFTQPEAKLITTGMVKLIGSLVQQDLYSSGRSFTQTFKVTSTVYRVTVRLWFFSPSREVGDGGTCSVSPDHSFAISGRLLSDAFWRVYNLVAPEAESQGFGRILGIWKMFGIEYISWFEKPTRDDLLNYAPKVFNTSNQINVSTLSGINEINDLDYDDCWPYRTSLIGGAEASTGSIFGAQGILNSKNGRYRAIMQSDCNFVLYDWLDKRRVIWSTKTQNRGRGCYISLQIDGNMVLVDGTGRKPYLFASDRYCQPQPNCVLTVGLTVEDNGVIVIWETDQQRELWREPR